MPTIEPVLSQRPTRSCNRSTTDMTRPSKNLRSASKRTTEVNMVAACTPNTLRVRVNRRAAHADQDNKKETPTAQKISSKKHGKAPKSSIAKSRQETRGSPSKRRSTLETPEKTPRRLRGRSNCSSPSSARNGRAKKTSPATSDCSIPTATTSGSDVDSAVFTASSNVSPVPSEGSLKGREREYNVIRDNILDSIRTSVPSSLYISGIPGTGKTATTRRVLDSLRGEVECAVINCVSLKNEGELIAAVLAAMNQELKTRRGSRDQLIAMVRGLKRHLVVVLDEVDHLSVGSNAALYAAFNWPHDVSSKIILIGIANSIDLTERLLPKLKLSGSTPPNLLVFQPYTKENIVEILSDKMEGASIDSKAVELCARKVAAMSGDLRTALHVYNQTKAAATPERGGTAGCREVLGVLNRVYSSPLARARLPIQPRILLSICLALSNNKKKPLTKMSLINAYGKACDVVKIPKLDSEDLDYAFQTLETQSFVSVTNQGLIRLQVDAKTAQSAIADNVMIEQITNNVK